MPLSILSKKSILNIALFFALCAGIGSIMYMVYMAGRTVIPSRMLLLFVLVSWAIGFGVLHRSNVLQLLHGYKQARLRTNIILGFVCFACTLPSLFLAINSWLAGPPQVQQVSITKKQTQRGRYRGGEPYIHNIATYKYMGISKQAIFSEAYQAQFDTATTLLITFRHGALGYCVVADKSLQ